MAVVRYFAGARAAAGIAEERVEAPDLATLLIKITQVHGQPLTKILEASSYLVDGLGCRDLSTPLGAGTTVDVLPPFAGG